LNGFNLSASAPLPDRVRERNILSVTAAAHFLTHLYMLVFPSLALVLQPAFDMPLDQILAISFWMYLLYGIAALPAGIISDLVSPRAMLIVCLFGMGGFAVAASRAATPAELRWSLAGLGLFASIYHPAGMALISRGVRRRGWALGFNGVFGSLGVVMAPILTGLLAANLGWRGTYLVLGLPGLLTGFVALLLRVGGFAEQVTLSPSVRSLQRRALAFAILCVAMMLGGIAYRGQTLVLPAYFAERITFLVEIFEGVRWWPALGTKSVAATLLTSLAYVAGLFGQMAGGSLADRFDLRKLYLGFHALSLPLLFLLGHLAGLPLLLCALVYAFFAFGMQPIENSLVAVLTPPRLRSTGFGMKFIRTVGVGSLAVHLVGRWQQAGGLESVFPRLALCILLLVLCAAILWWFTRHEDFSSRAANSTAKSVHG
jgi:MFS family permease